MGNVNGQGASLVDTDLSTAEKTTNFNADGEEITLSHLCLKYERRSMPEGIRLFLPKIPIIKRVDDRVLIGRSKNADVFLNDTCMSRNYIEIWASSNDSHTYFIKNVSQNKSVQIDGLSLRYGELGILRDKSELVLDYIIFAVSVKPAVEDGTVYILSTECCDDLGQGHNIYTIRGDILPNKDMFTGFTLIPGYPNSSNSGVSFKVVNGNSLMSENQNGQILGQFPLPNISVSSSSSFQNTTTVGINSITSSQVDFSQNYNFPSQTTEILNHFRLPQEHSMSNEKMNRLPCEGIDNAVVGDKQEFYDSHEKIEHY